MEKKQIIKKKYEKPNLRVLSIVSSVQTLGIGCKMTDNIDVKPGTVPCAPGSGTACFQPGS